MSHTLRRIRAALLRRLSSGESVEIGAVGPSEPYPPHIAQAIGPMVAGLHRLRLIEHAGATYASRPTRRRTVARLWRALMPDVCGHMADADEAWLAAHPDDSADPPTSGPRQRVLF